MEFIKSKHNKIDRYLYMNINSEIINNNYLVLGLFSGYIILFNIKTF